MSLRSWIARAAVLVFAASSDKWFESSRSVKAARPDQQGMFKIRSLPPGQRYLAVAVDYLEDGEANDPEFLGAMKGKASAMTLGDGESKSVSLKLVTR